MSILLQIILRSLETGSVYALAALGIIIIFRTSFVTNFAQGSIGMINTFVVTFFLMKTGLPVWLCTIFGLFTGFITGILVDVVIIRHTKKVSPVGKQIITLGLIMVLLGIAPMIFGVDPLLLPPFIDNGNFKLLGATITYNGILNISLGLVIMISLFYILQKTKIGLAVRATASNEVMARLVGVPTRNVTMGAWAIAAMLSTLAGVMIAPVTTVSLNLMDNVQINAFVAIVLGGFQTFYGPVLAAYIIAVGKNLIAVYGSSIWAEQILYLIVLLVLIIRPYGLIGKKTVKKV